MNGWNFVDSRIFYGIILFLTVSTGSVFAQESLISVQTDDNHYDEGDTIVISGKVTTLIGNTPATLQIVQKGNLAHIAQITIAQDGTYSHTIIAEGQLWRSSGEHTVRILYGEGNIAESSFIYTSKAGIKEIIENFEVNAGSYGTFDIKYTIKGATIKDIAVNPKIFGIVVQIDATDDGTMTLDMPREFIGAEKQDGKDDEFIVRIDSREISYIEAAVHLESRVITIDFEQGDSDIEIIGTYVVPEFGAIAMMILIIGIMSTILITRNKIQLNI